MRILFIHRSVGRHLMRFGDLRARVQRKGSTLDDYDNNNGALTLDNGDVLKDAIKIPGNNTNPVNLAAFFTEWPSVLNKYHVIAIKSCYPNSHIKDRAQLDAIKHDYQTIISASKARNKKLVIITTPPLRPLFANTTEARLAGDLADWLVKSASEGVHVYDLHGQYSEDSGKHKGMLKLRYRRPLPWDNHPNRFAHRAAGPGVADALTKEE